VGIGGKRDLARVGGDGHDVAELDVEHGRRLGMELGVALPHALGHRVGDLVQGVHARQPAVVEMV